MLNYASIIGIITSFSGYRDEDANIDKIGIVGNYGEGVLELHPAPTLHQCYFTQYHASAITWLPSPW